MERFLDYFVPERYRLNLFVDKDAKTISGVVEVFGKVLAETVKFHAVNIEVESVEVDGKSASFECGDGVITIFKVPRSASCIKVAYHGSLNKNMEGAYISTYEYEGHTETIVATQFESHYAREAFPCIDEPAAKAVFELKITKPDDGDLVLANTPEVDKTKWVDSVNDGKTGQEEASCKCEKVEFEPTPRMSTYLLAFVIGKFHGKTVTNEHGVEITTYAALNQDVDSVDFANEVAAKSLEFYDDNFGVKYPLPRLIQVALPDFEAGAMENWGLVTYRESMLLAGESATLGTKKGVALTVTHELSHQWFGDLVTMQWWDDLWLNESFASVMEYFATDYIHPEYKIFENFFTGDALAALRRDCLSGVQPVHQDVKDPAEIATLFDPAIVYAKGARLMLMIIRSMGWNDFCLSVKEYFEKYKYSNTKGDDLWMCLNKHARFDVKSLMHAFIDRPGYPVLKNVSGDDFTDYEQKRFLLDGEMKKSDWLLPEIAEDMSGHYILNLSEAEFNERLGRFDKIGLEEKLRLLIDRDLISKTDLASSTLLLPLLEKFKNESSAAVWSIILTIISGLKVFFDFDSPEEKKYKKFVGELVKLKLLEIGIVTKDGDDENTLRLRGILLALSFYAEDEEILKKLAEMYSDDYAQLDNEIRSDILDAKVFLEPELVDNYIEDYQKMPDPEIKFDLLFATTLVRDKKELKKLIDLLKKPEIVKPQDQFYLFLYLFRNPVVKTEVFDWLQENWEYVKKQSGDKSLENYPRYTASSIRTEEEYASWKEFFGKFKKEPALSRAIEVGENEIKARLKLIEKDKKAINKWVGDIK